METNQDTYLSIETKSNATITEKRSKFIAVILPIDNLDEIKTVLKEYKKKYYDARHVCYAYRLGKDGTIFRANDDGEPSGTAGKPILGALRSHELTNVLAIVVRYFGGVKLGTGGLTVAYKTATHEAINNGIIISKIIEKQVHFFYDYIEMNQVMKIVKELSPTILEQIFENQCELTLSIRESKYNLLIERLKKIDSTKFPDSN